MLGDSMSKKSKREFQMKQRALSIGVTDSQEELAQPESQPEKMEFDAWWASRSKSIPSIHHKEIVKADIMARGLSEEETAEDYDIALAKYGIKIN
jgi:hypothetical protein